MKKFLATTAVALTAATGAFASGPTIPVEPYVAPMTPMPVGFNWGGGYAGVALSYNNGTAEDLTFGPGEFDLRGAGFSGFAGFNAQRGNLVFGGEIALGMNRADGSDGAFMLPLELENSVELRGRLGYATGRVMPYVALGVISSRFSADHAGFGLETDMADERFNGATLALGIDAMVGNNMFVRGELQTVRYRDNTLPFYDDTDPHTLSANNMRLSLGVGWRF